MNIVEILTNYFGDVCMDRNTETWLCLYFVICKTSFKYKYRIILNGAFANKERSLLKVFLN